MTTSGTEDSNTFTGPTARRIIIVSDGTGETASHMIKAALVQFGGENVYFTRYKNVRERSQIDAICEEAAFQKNLVVYTIVSPRLRAYLRRKTRQSAVPTVDLLGPLLIGLAQYFDYKPKLIAGLLRDVNETYFQRIDAMEYTIAHDDGRDFNDLDKADLVILGISRTSKTPLSMYLSHQGWKVANIPIIKGFQIPQELYDVDPRRVVCLTIDPRELIRIRQARLSRLGQDKGGDYAEPSKVSEEVEYANELYRRNRRWVVFNVTGKALEETASEIIKLMAARRLTPANAPDSGMMRGALPSPDASGKNSGGSTDPTSSSSTS